MLYQYLVLELLIRPYLYSQNWTGVSLQWRLLWGNIIKKRFLSFEIEKVPCISLSCNNASPSSVLRIQQWSRYCYCGKLMRDESTNKKGNLVYFFKNANFCRVICDAVP